MNHINVTINGRQYRMACEEGQEVRLLKLAENLEQRIEQLRGKFGEIGDTRLTVMAALTIADTLSETGSRIKRLEEEVSTLQDARAEASERAKATLVAIIAALNAAAERIEVVTKKLNQSGGGNSDGVAMG